MRSSCSHLTRQVALPKPNLARVTVPVVLAATSLSTFFVRHRGSLRRFRCSLRDRTPVPTLVCRNPTFKVGSHLSVSATALRSFSDLAAPLVRCGDTVCNRPTAFTGRPLLAGTPTLLRSARAFTRSGGSALGCVPELFRVSIRHPIYLHAGVCFALSHSRATLAVSFAC